MAAPESELRAASDSLLVSLDRLAAMEAEKRTLMPEDSRLVELAQEVRELAAKILGTATVQSDLAETAHVMAMTDEPDAPTRPIEATHRPLHEILEEWRAAERDLDQTAVSSPRVPDALARVRALRAEYQRAFTDAERATNDA